LEASSAACPGFTKNQFNGGREAVASTKKSMRSIDFFVDVTEPPQSPVFCYAAFPSPEGGHMGGLLTAAQIDSTAGGSAKNAPKCF
jgi:hypothetical protein